MGPLAGIKIIEMKGIGPGPYAGQVLADLGAEVIVVERASKTNSIAPPSEVDVNSRGKKSIALDLRNPAGLEVLLKMVESADVIFEGNRPGVAERLGFGPDVCLERNPKITFGRMTGWGQHGAMSHSAGHDYNYISLTGVAAAIGSKEKPMPPLNLIGDYAAGSLFLVIGILSALHEVKVSGKGQVIDAAITDGAAHLMSIFHTMTRMGVFNVNREANMLDGGLPYYDSYQTADDKFVSVASIEPQFFAEMVEKAGLPEWYIKDQNNPEKWPEMKATMSDTFKSKTRDQWVEIFEGSDACVAGIYDVIEAPKHPHNQSRNTYLNIDGADQPAPAPRFSRTECEVPKSPAKEGADTKQVLCEFGFSEEDISELDRSGVLT